MAELSTASISRRGVQKKPKAVKVPGRQRLYTPPITPITVAAQRDINSGLLFYVGGAGAGTHIVHGEENKEAALYDPNTRNGLRPCMRMCDGG